MTSRECPPEAVLSRYAAGDLSDADASAVDTHLGGCHACLSRLDELAHQPSSLVAALRLPRDTAVYQPTALARAVAAVLHEDPPPEPPPPAELNGYRLQEELGRGGM